MRLPVVAVMPIDAGDVATCVGSYLRQQVEHLTRSKRIDPRSGERSYRFAFVR